MMRNNSRFTRGFAGMKGGVYKCGACGRMTRDTGNDEAGLGLCRECSDEGFLENSYSDGHITKEEYDREMAEIEKRRKVKDDRGARHDTGRVLGTGPGLLVPDEYRNEF